jgi:hypothetical protein
LRHAERDITGPSMRPDAAANEAMRRNRRALFLAAAGLAAVAIGLWEGAHIVRDIVYQAQGKCDYLSCTGPLTLPSLAGDIVLVAAGAAPLVMWAYRAGRGPATAVKG